MCPDQSEGRKSPHNLQKYIGKFLTCLALHRNHTRVHMQALALTQDPVLQGMHFCKNNTMPQQLPSSLH